MIDEKSHLMVLQVSTAQFLHDLWENLSMKVELVSVEDVQACGTMNNKSAGKNCQYDKKFQFVLIQWM